MDKTGGKTVFIYMADDERCEKRLILDRSDFNAFPGRALYKCYDLHNPGTNAALEAITMPEQLDDQGCYCVRQGSTVKRLEGWRDSMVVGGEAAAEQAGITFAKSLPQGMGAVITPLRSTGQLRDNKGTYTAGQVDAGVTVGTHTLLLSKKTRILHKDVVGLSATISLIYKFRDRESFDSLREFRGKTLHGALVADALPEDAEEREAVMDQVKTEGFALFLRSGADYACHVDCGTFLR